ncbi:MAG: hypothetical protein DME22_15385 [Verrucomicrobia bacterium]|nr:MAG: hypothetical protein DME22_15385 [Verrucomicrobiota bacterium]
MHLVKDTVAVQGGLKPSRAARNAIRSKPAAVAHRTDRGALNLASVVRRRDCSATILLVEDDPAVREVMRKILLNACYQVLTAESEAQALEIWERFNLQIDPDLKVIYTSGFGREICDRDPALTASSFLQKPFTPEELMIAVAATLENKAEFIGTLS